MPTVDVVIPTWNQRDLLMGALRSLAAQRVEHRVYVVDNGSLDGTAEAVSAEHPSVVVCRLSTNHGFGRAVNVGIRAGNGDVVVVLNNDVEAEPNFLSELLKPFEDRATGCVAGVLLTADGGSVDAAGITVDRSLAGYSNLHGKVAADHLVPTGFLAPCGGAAAYRRVVLETVGLFDEEIFAYSEDVDLGLRMAAAGCSTVLAWGARVRHLGSATLGHRSEAQLRLSSWSRGYLLGRYRVAPAYVVVELLLALLDSLANRTAVPLLQRMKGYRRGRSLPARPTPVVDLLAMTRGLPLRWAAFRGHY